MTELTVFLVSNQVIEYEFGYSTSSDVNDVSNWQSGKNIFLNVTDGTYYAFARLIGTNQFFTKAVSVNCNGCTVAADGYYDITPNSCRVAADGYIDITSAIAVNEGILIIGIDV